MYFNSPCQNNHRLSKETLLASLNEDRRSFFESMPDENWSILSFNPTNREACIRITSAGIEKTISVALLGSSK